MPRHSLTLKAVAVVPDSAPKYIAVPLFDEADDNQDHLVRTIGSALTERVLDLMRAGQMSGRYREFNLMPGEGATEWCLFIGIGKKEENKRPYRRDDRLRSMVAMSCRHFRRMGLLTFSIQDFSAFGVTAERAGVLIAEGAVLGTYRYDIYRSKKAKHQTACVEVLTGSPTELQASLDRGSKVAESMCEARDLINAPSSDLRPKDFVAKAREMVAEFSSLHLKILDRAAMEQEKMGLHLAVAKGSAAEPYVCIIEHTPSGVPQDAPWELALVGKGVTFDSGGYNLKSGAGMRRMYRDMAGAGAVFGAMRSIAALNLPVRVVGIMPLAENMVNGEAFRPGDVLHSRKGITVEIANTDAEGRLLLADSLSYAVDTYRPQTLVDLATLTGAVRVALGLFVSGLFTHSQEEGIDESFAIEMRNIGRQTGEWVWRLPLDEDYQVQLGSRVADVANCNLDGKSGAGSTTAACFLRRFIDFDVVQRWAHLDIAATAFMERTVIYNKCPYMPREGATGVGVRLITELAAQLADPE